MLYKKKIDFTKNWRKEKGKWRNEEERKKKKKTKLNFDVNEVQIISRRNQHRSCGDHVLVEISARVDRFDLLACKLRDLLQHSVEVQEGDRPADVSAPHTAHAAARLRGVAHPERRTRQRHGEPGVVHVHAAHVHDPALRRARDRCLVVLFLFCFVCGYKKWTCGIIW